MRTACEAHTSPIAQVSTGVNNVYGAAQSRQDTPTIKYLGDFKTVSQCEAKATADQRGFLSFTFHTPAFGGDFAGQCFGRTDDNWAPTVQVRPPDRFLGPRV